MKRPIALLSSLILLFIFSSCIYTGPSVKGNGNVVEENRKVGDFEKIEISRGMNVYISKGDNRKVVVEADENLQEIIEVRTEDDLLIIKAKQNIRNAKTKKVFVSAPHISKIKSSSGSNVYSETKLPFKKIELSSSSGSNMNLDVSSETIEASASSGSNIKIKGKTKNFMCKTSSGSNVKAEKLKSEICTAKASSGSNIWISVTESLDANVSSGSNVFVSGDPVKKNIDKSSGGNVIIN